MVLIWRVGPDADRAHALLLLPNEERSCFGAQGPTLTMRIHAYSLMRDVTATLQRPRQPASMWKSPPLVVMNNFGGTEDLKLATVLFQNLFPAINVQTANLSSCQVGAHLGTWLWESHCNGGLHRFWGRFWDTQCAEKEEV